MKRDMTIGPPRTEIDTWVGRITERWRDSVGAIMDVGRLLIEAKAALAHGEFEKMIKARLPFKPTTAQRLMVICRDSRLLEPALRQSLPPSWGTLYELTKLTNQEFDAAIEQKIIRPDVERWEIEGLRRATKLNPPSAKDKPWSPAFPSPDPRRWSVAQLRLNARILQRLLDHVANASEVETIGDLIGDPLLRQIWEEMQ